MILISCCIVCLFFLKINDLCIFGYEVLIIVLFLCGKFCYIFFVINGMNGCSIFIILFKV